MANDPQKAKITTQKDKSTTQKTIQKDKFTTQKSETTTQKTIQKDKSTTQKNESTTQKRILDFLKNHPKANRIEVAKSMGDITEDGVKFIIGKLQRQGLLKREGGRKNGYWVVIDRVD